VSLLRHVLSPLYRSRITLSTWTSFIRAGQDANNNWRTKRKSDKETHREILADVWRNFPKEKRDRVFVISTAEPARGDFEELETAIRKCLPEVKADKFLAFAMAYSEKGLKKKRMVAEKHAARIALLSAGNAFNPIPGLGIARSGPCRHPIPESCRRGVRRDVGGRFGVMPARFSEHVGASFVLIY
jgi:hypothetical protein